MIGAPSVRYGHTAVWASYCDEVTCRDEMLVWGGHNGSPTGGVLNTGAAYNPFDPVTGTDVWTTISTTGAPSPRLLHTAAWTGSEMVIWGGADIEFPSLTLKPLGDGKHFTP